jgi:predicted permease
MLKNYLKTALRNLLREKSNTLLNIAGLTLGITGSIVLFLVVKNANSFDKYHVNYDRIYRAVSTSKGNNGDNFTQGIPAPLPEAIRTDFSSDVDAVAFTSYRRGSLITVLHGNDQTKKYEEAKGLVFTEPSFFEIFDRKMLIGSAEKGLDDPNEAIISQKWALKYFGRENVVGENVQYDDLEYTITAVMEDYPANTDLPFDLMLSSVTIKKQLQERGWHDISDTDNCYFLIKENVSIDQLKAQIPSFVEKYLGDRSSNANESTFILQPLKELHSDNRFGNYNTKLPRMAQYVFSVIAVFLLLMACINFINLATAEAIKRTREVGIRKLLGSSRWQLIFQFLGEAFIVTMISVALSLLVARGLIEFINPFMEISLSLNLHSDGIVWIFLGVLTVVVTVFSGFYPALVVSSFKPALAIKNQTGPGASSGNTLRKGLVVLQFFISQFFIISTIVIVRQMDFVQNHDTGFARDRIITIPIPSQKEETEARSSRMRTLKNEMMRLSDVQQASLNYAPPSFKAVYGTSFSMPGSDDVFDTQVKFVDGDYIPLYDIKLVAGEGLADSDSVSGLVVNEKLAEVVGFKSYEMVGRQISLWGELRTVRGVVKDFNTTSLERAIEPVMLVNNIDGYQSMSLKLGSDEFQTTVKQVKELWEEAYPEYIFSYNFVDDEVRSLYKGIRKVSSFLSIFSSIAIVIGCLGLFGLVTFMTNQKTKEIGVRKVLGASVATILFFFSKQFLTLILIGFALTVPLVWFLMTKLLEQFAYKITLSPTIFITGLTITIFIAVLTVGFRSYRAARANPVRSLRSE